MVWLHHPPKCLQSTPFRCRKHCASTTLFRVMLFPSRLEPQDMSRAWPWDCDTIFAPRALMLILEHSGQRPKTQLSVSEHSLSYVQNNVSDSPSLHHCQHNHQNCNLILLRSRSPPIPSWLPSLALYPQRSSSSCRLIQSAPLPARRSLPDDILFPSGASPQKT